MANFGPWVRREMARREWTQADLARQSGTSGGRISEWLAAKRTPSPASCARLAELFGADLDHVLTLAGHRPPSFRDEDDPERAGLLALLRRAELTPERAAVLRALLEVWARYPVEP